MGRPPNLKENTLQSVSVCPLSRYHRVSVKGVPKNHSPWFSFRPEKLGWLGLERLPNDVPFSRNIPQVPPWGSQDPNAWASELDPG